MQFEKVWLSKRELIFLEEATQLFEQVYDMNLSNRDFRLRYKVQKGDAKELIEKLNEKLNTALDYVQD